MSINGKRFITLGIAVLMIIGATMTVKAAPPPAPALWIIPETLNFETATTNLGDRFNVTVWISTTAAAFTWQVKVNFNASQILAVRAAYTGTGKSLFFDGHGTIPVSAIIDNSTGYVVHGESLVGFDSVPAGSNSLFWIEFQIALEPSGTPLSSLISIDQGSDTFVLDPDLNVMAGFSYGSAFYTFTPPLPKRDVAVINLSLSSDHPKEDDNVTITVGVLNNGTQSETFNVEVYLDALLIAQQAVSDLPVEGSATQTFEWNTTGMTLGLHTIKAAVTGMAFDTDPSNDFLTKSITIVSKLGPVTDVNGDGKVDMLDIGIVAFAFGSSKDGPGDRWNPNADVNGDNVVNLKDIFYVAKDFWK